MEKFKFYNFALVSLTIFLSGAVNCNAQELERFGGEEKVAPANPSVAETSPSNSNAKPAPVFVSSDPTAHLAPAESRAAMRINPEAPGPFIGLAEAYFRGDNQEAKLYAKQFVRYLSDLMFAVKDITGLIGQAMIEQGQIEDDEWVGVEQYLDFELTKARAETGSAIKATNEDALKRITPDPKGELEIYYFFTLNSSYARKMTPDVERLWQIAKKDPRIKMVGLTLGAQPKEFISTYRNYTGLTLPVFDGQLVAKTFNIAFVPAIVIVSPNSKTAYLKTGQQSFERLYQVVKTAQGESTALSKEAIALKQKKIGSKERESVGSSRVITATDNRQALSESVLSKINYSEGIQGQQGITKF